MKKKTKYLFLFFVIIIIIILIYFFLASNKQKNNIEEKIVNYVISTVPIDEKIKESKLDEIFTNNFGEDTDYSVVIKNFETGEEFKFQETEEYNSASLYKLWVFAVAMQQINDNELDLNEIISGDKNKFDEMLGVSGQESTNSDSPEEVEGVDPIYISMKVADAIEKMITESDNYAALLLTQKVGYKNVDLFLEKNGFGNSNFGRPPKTTAEDIASFYEKIYGGEIIDKSTSGKMLEVLKRQTWNDRIPKYLPENIEVAHKTGELFGAKHDTGIVYSENGDYLIVVLSQTGNESIAAEKIAKFSEDIYEYFLQAD